MNTVHQKLFKKAFLEAKNMVNKYKMDHVIIDTDRFGSSKFKICSANSFFEKRIKYDKIVCYLSHPGEKGVL